MDKIRTYEEFESLLDVAINLILEQNEGQDFICEELHKISKEFEFCSTHCQNLSKECVMRFLKTKMK